MIKVICNDNKLLYNAYNLAKAFYLKDEVKSLVSPDSEHNICIEFQEGKNEKIHAADIRELYEKLRSLCGKDLPWGMLTGVRPVKLAVKWIAENIKGGAVLDGAEEDFCDWFYKERFVSRKKAETAFRIALKEAEIISGIRKDNIKKTGIFSGHIPGYSLYVSVPFCPSVCSYCSFSSGSIDKYKGKVDSYLKALRTEMELTAERFKKTGSNHPVSVYIGGGTPTSLSAPQLEMLLDDIERIFGIRRGISDGNVKEYTVEAGRPDSITDEKLELIKRYGATRISVNPQTMQQKTLDRIGRRHTAEDIKHAFYMAREKGFDNINMDLIMGLPGETLDDVRDTLKQIRDLSPDSLTVHALAVKRASAIGIAKKTGGQTAEEAKDIEAMTEAAYYTAYEMGMFPYYLYRQKSISGNFENIGFSLKGKEGIYNILMMEEVQSIAACGAGAASKTVSETLSPNPARNGMSSYIVRSENVKNVDDYINKFQM